MSVPPPDTPDRASPTHPQPLHHARANGETLAYHLSAPAAHRQASACRLVWLSGFHSDMTGSKALALHQWAEDTGRGYLRFDYYGHGQSSGDFAHGTISQWVDDTLAVIDTLIDGPLVLVGSSMGGWLALLAALQRPERVKGLVLIAPAADFTQTLMWDVFDSTIRDQITTTGQWLRPSVYEGEDTYPITRALIDDGRKHLLLTAPSIPLTLPVHMLQGTADDAVPWQHAVTTAEKLASDDVVVTLVKDGDHRLSTDRDIARLIRAVEAMCAKCDAMALGAPD